MNLYNEIEPYAAQWLRNLVDAGHLVPGVVETRSIVDLKPEDVRSHVQAHFFAGIGVWSYALRCAGWPDALPVWTGSCPCQPFSSAGRRKGTSDARHLWPEWFRLIAECRPPVVLGEQVASPDGLRWLDAVSSDLERAGYAVGAADLCAAGVGAPHIRQRLFFVAYAGGDKRGSRRGREEVQGLSVAQRTAEQPSRRGDDVRELGDASGQGPQERSGRADGRRTVRDEGPSPSAPGAWDDVDWLPCADGKQRPTQPGLHPLADGAANRVGKLRAYGNAICAPVATTFIRGVMRALDSL
jgi:DNA (cytosine-5)-methyltransferase 1